MPGWERPGALSGHDLEALIRRLGSENFEIREQATRQLLKFRGSDAALRRALASADLEVARRLRAVLASRAGQRQEDQRRRMAADARAGQADLLAERMVRWDGADDDPGCWQPLLDLCWRLRRLAPERVEKDNLIKSRPAPAFHRYVADPAPRFLPAGVPLLRVTSPDRAKVDVFAGRGVRVEGRSLLISDGLFASAGDADFKETQLTVRTFLLAGGAVKVNSGLQLVVVCDGDFEAERGVAGCTIVARGAVRTPRMQNCLILAGGEVQITDYLPVRNCLIRSAGRVVMHPRAVLQGSEVRERDPGALDCVRFFEPRQVGAEVSPAEGGARVARLDAGKPFARAGLRPGDLVLSLNGSAVRGPDGFRKLLRQAVAAGDEAVLRVRREGKEVEVRVPLEE